MSNEINKFEQMLEKLTADDRTAAEALFHEIVVEKSRAIYSNLLETDLADVEVADAPAEAIDEAKKKSDKKEDDKEDSKEMKKESTETATAEVAQPAAEVAAPIAATTEVGGDATDAMIADIEEPEADKSDEKEDSKEDKIEDKIEDLEDAVEELKAEFEKMMSGEGDKEDGAEEKEEAVQPEVQPSAEVAPVAQAAATTELGAQPAAESKTDREQMREYVDKVSVKHADNTDNKKSPTPAQGKAVGGEAVDFVGSEEKGRPAPKAEKNDAGNVNVPGGAAKLVKAKGPVTADKSDNKTSILGSK